MRRSLSYLILTLLLLVLCGCGEQGFSPTVSAREQAVDLAAENPGPAETFRLDAGTSEFSDYLSGVYDIDAHRVQDGTIYYASGVQAYEIAVLQTASQADLDYVAEKLEAYVERRKADFFGYAPRQYEILESAQILQLKDEGQAALIVCGEESDYAGEDQPNGSSTPVETTPVETTPVEATPVENAPAENAPVETTPANAAQTGERDMTVYDVSPIVSAYRSGDGSGLTEQDAAVLAVCRQIMDTVITGGMTDCEKELALHDWLVAHVSYDDDALVDHSAGSPNNTTPYGALVEERAICLGYAVTFHLFMELADIESQVVVGKSFHEKEDHAWCLVSLEDEWYAVDPTWDAPLGLEQMNLADDDLQRIHHKFFNVTSDYLRATDHQWDQDAVPEATGTKYAWNLE